MFLYKFIELHNKLVNLFMCWIKNPCLRNNVISDKKMSPKFYAQSSHISFFILVVLFNLYSKSSFLSFI